MADLEPHIPEQIEHIFGHAFRVGGAFIVGLQK